MSQQLARVFETAIAEHPQDWHMLQRVFTADLARGVWGDGIPPGGGSPGGRPPGKTGADR